jgi:hypothetical protein
MSKLGKSADAVGGVPIMSVMWFTSRAFLPAGFIPLDGQLLTRTVYPSAWDEINNGRVPVVTEAAWATNTNRGSFTVGDGSTTFRLPDFNGKSSGSAGAVFLRGDGTSSAGTDGLLQLDAMQGHAHSLSSSVAMKSGSGSATTGASTTVGSGAVTPDTTGITSDGFNGTPRVSAETRPLNVTGCFAIKLFGVITTADMQSTSAVSAQVAEMYARGGRKVVGPLISLSGLQGVTLTGANGIPSWCTKVTMRFMQMQLSAADSILLQLLDAGGNPITSGYSGFASSLGTGNSTAGGTIASGFTIWAGSSSNIANGHAELTFDASGAVFSALVGGGASTNFGTGVHTGVNSTPPGIKLFNTNVATYTAASKFQMIFE